MKPLFVIDHRDNVATALEDIDPGMVTLAGDANGEILVKEMIPRGHKVAMREISKDEVVIKHGHPVAVAIRTISPGEWVHTHNVR